MKHFVARTCTVVSWSERKKEPRRETKSNLAHEPQSYPPRVVSAQAGVRAARASWGRQDESVRARGAGGRGGGPSPPVTSRRSILSRNWENATLYIDGLDETRAGATDGRTPFDAIRRKLQHLSRPRFRLSCRDADWFGANDRERLKAVSPDGEVLVLRLDPMSEEGILENLVRNLDSRRSEGVRGTEARTNRG